MSPSISSFYDNNAMWRHKMPTTAVAHDHREVLVTPKDVGLIFACGEPLQTFLFGYTTSTAFHCKVGGKLSLEGPVHPGPFVCVVSTV